MPFLRPYGTGTGSDIIIPLIKAGEVNHAVSADWTPASGDVKVSKNGGAAANIGTLPTFITNIGWKFVFSDAELECKTLSIQVTDSATKAVEDQHFIIETYGDASAMHPVFPANVLQVNSDATAAVRQAQALGLMILGTVDNTTVTQSGTLFGSDDVTEATEDHYLGRSVYFLTGALAGQRAKITGYVIEMGLGHANFTVEADGGGAMTDTPADTDTFLIV